MRLLSRFWMNRAAKRYATRLPAVLARSYGASAGKLYPPAQIRAAVSKSKLNRSYIALAYAAFLPEEAFNALAGEMPISIPYAEARAAFAAHLPNRRFASESNAYGADWTMSEGGIGGGSFGGGGPD